MTPFDAPKKQTFWNTVGKGEICNFSFSHSDFYLFG